MPLLVASVIESRIFTLINERGVRNPGDFDSLAVLRRTGDPYELSPKQLAGQLLVTSASLRGRLDRLQTAGLIGRRSHATDRRAVIVTLTRRGQELTDEVYVGTLELYEEALSGLIADDQQQLADLLRVVLLDLGDT